MKKLLIALISAVTVAGSASAYTATVINRSSQAVHVEIEYPACANDVFNLNPGQVKDVNMKACCISSFTAQPLSKSGGFFPTYGEKKYLDMRQVTTGAGIRCASIVVGIEDLGAGQITLTTGE